MLVTAYLYFTTAVEEFPDQCSARRDYVTAACRHENSNGENDSVTSEHLKLILLMPIFVHQLLKNNTNKHVNVQGTQEYLEGKNAKSCASRGWCWCKSRWLRVFFDSISEYKHKTSLRWDWACKINYCIADWFHGWFCWCCHVLKISKLLPDCSVDGALIILC